MSDLERRFHETWLGMVQPVEGLVVSVPVLVDAQCMERQPPAVREKLVELCPPSRVGEAGPEGHRVFDLARLFGELRALASRPPASRRSGDSAGASPGQRRESWPE